MITRFKYAASALVICSLVIANASAKTYTQKTFLAPRPVGFNSEMEYTTWHEHVYKKRSNKSLRTHLMATGFYQASQNNSGLAKYFGAGNPCDCPIREGFILGTAAEIAEGKADLEHNLLVNKDGTALRGEVCWSPEQEIWGVRLDYFQDVFHPFDKMYLKASLPIVYVQSDMHMRVSKSEKAALLAGDFSLRDFLAGNLDNSIATKNGTDNTSQLAPLKKAKIPCGKRDTTSTADLDIALGYKFKEDEKSHFFGHAAITIPLGSRVRGEYLFEPIAGNNRHWGLGLGIDAGAHLWNNDKASFRFLTSLNYKYLFENCEMRTIGIDPCFTGNRLSHYLPLGKTGQINKPLQPAANILSQLMYVRPGHMFDGLIALSFNSSNFTLDFGYSLFFKDAESLSFKNQKCFDIEQYGLASASYNTATDTFGASADHLVGGRLLKTSDLDLDAAKTPWQLSHKLFAGIGYTSTIYKAYPASIGIGGSYEFASDNAALENAALWVKTAFSF